MTLRGLPFSPFLTLILSHYLTLLLFSSLSLSLRHSYCRYLADVFERHQIPIRERLFDQKRESNEFEDEAKIGTRRHTSDTLPSLRTSTSFLLPPISLSFKLSIAGPPWARHASVTPLPPLSLSLPSPLPSPLLSFSSEGLPNEVLSRWQCTALSGRPNMFDDQIGYFALSEGKEGRVVCALPVTESGEIFLTWIFSR
jgi:hypothetical protein